MLSVKDVTVSFDGFKAVDSVSFDLPDTALHVIIGPNGAGKTTLLDIICGKTKPDSGSVRFNGIELTAIEEFEITRAGVTRKFQNPSVYEDLTVYENLEISLPLGRGVFGSLFYRSTRETEGEIRSVVEQIFLENKLYRLAGELSHGEKQWLEIGMMLVQHPKVLLLDEPVAGMTPKEREQTATLLRRVASDKAILVIEHDMDFVENVARDVTVMHQGSILCEGPFSKVKGDPRVIEVYLGEAHA